MLINWLPAALLSRRSLIPQSTTRRKRSTRRLSIERAEERLVLTAWTPIGPAPVLNGWANNEPVSGRVTGIAADQGNANTLYIATAGGGVWKTTNGGASWSPLTDSVTDGSGNPLPGFMGAIAETDATIGPNIGQQIVYAGTGEANNSLDSFYGNGILVSTNGGATWTLTDAGGALVGTTISKIVIDGSDKTGATAYAAVADGGINGSVGNTGIWKTTDYGAHWTNLTGNALLSTTASWSDVVVDPKTPTTIYAAEGDPSGTSGNGVYKSTDGGVTWALLGAAPNGATTGRISLALYDVGATNELIISVSEPFSAPNSGELASMVQSMDGGATFTALTPPSYMGSAGFGQGWYDTTLAIDPTNSLIIYAGGTSNGNGLSVDQNIMSFDGGVTWTDISLDSLGNGPHTDDHAVAFDKSGNLIDGNDGGVWRLNNPTSPTTYSWTDLNTNLQTILFNGIAVDPSGNVYGGTEEDGSDKYTGSVAWNQLVGGDGGYMRVDPTNPNIVYQEFSGVSLQVSMNGGTTFTDISPNIPTSNSNFFAPYVLDASGNIYFGGDNLYLSKDHGSTFTAIAKIGTNGFNPGAAAVIDSVAVSQTNNNVVYVSSGGQLFVSKNAQSGTPTWTNVSLPGGFTAGAGNSLIVDPSVAGGGTAYAVVNSFGGGHVFKTTNFGASWTNISGNLPNSPVSSVAVNQTGTQIFVGTDMGVYSSNDGGTTWAQLGTGLPPTQVVELDFVAATNTLYAGTHGRGAYMISTAAPPPFLSIPTSTVTFLSNGPPVALAAGATLSNGNASYNTGNLTVQITANASAPDQLLVVNTANITVIGTTVKYQGNTIGTLAGGTGGAPLVVTFTTSSATVAAVQALVQAIDFNNTAVSPSTLQRTVQFTVNDGSSTSTAQDVFVNVQLSGPIIDFSTVTPITYTATNPPALIAPTASVSDLGTSNFDPGHLTVTITGNAIATDRLTVANAGLITVSGTTVSYNGSAIGTISGGTGATPLTVTFNTASATTTAVQALVRAIAFSNTAISPSTLARTVSFQLTDSQPVIGAAVTTQVNVQLAVPTITLAGSAPLTFTQDGPPLLIAPGSTVTDPLSSLNGGQLAVALSNNGSPNDQLVILNQGTGAGQIGVSGSTVTYGGLTIGIFSGGQGGAPLTVTFTTADATSAAVQALVRDIAFNNVVDPPSTAQRTVTLQLFDPQPASSAPVNVLINVVLVDNPPVINLNSVVATWTEGTPPVTLASGATVTYSDDSNFATGSLAVSLPVNGTPSDQLTIQTVGGITLSGSNVLFNGNVLGTVTGGSNGNPLVVSFTSTNATIAATQALIRAIGFSNNSANPSTLPRTVQFVINDGHGGLSQAVTMSVNVIGVDNSPTLTLGQALPFLANAPPAAIASAATVVDPDSPFFSGGSLVVTEKSGSPNDQLVVINQGSGANQIAVSGSSVFDAGTLIGTITSFGSATSPLSISLNGSASVGDVQDLVRAIGFGVTGAASTQTRSFTFTLNDGGGAAPVSQSTSIVVNAGGSQPVIVLQPSVNYAVGSPPLTVSPGATVTDPDSLTFNAGSLSVSIAQGITVNDRLTIQTQGSGLGQVMVSGQSVYYSGTLVGTLNQDGGIGLDPLIVTFNQQSSAAAVQAILRAVQFSTTGPSAAGPRLLQAIAIDDSQLPSAPAFEQTNVAVPTTPVTLAMGSPSTNYLRGSGPLFVDAGATLTDINATTFAKGTLTFQAIGGTKNHLAIGNTADIQVKNGKVRFDGVLIGTVKGGTVHLNASATAAGVQALIRAVTFSTNGTAGSRTVDFQFNDGHRGTAFASKLVIVN